MFVPWSGYPMMKLTPAWMRNRMSPAAPDGSGFHWASVNIIFPMSG